LYFPWWLRHVSRFFSIYLTRVLIRTRVTPDQVTVIMFMVAVVGALCFLPGKWAWSLAGAVLLQASLVVDCSDGEVARHRGISSLSGIYLDALSHYVIPSLTLFCASFGLSRALPGPWLPLGGAAALFMVWVEACYDLRFKAVYLGRRLRTLMERDSPGTAADTPPRPRSEATMQRLGSGWASLPAAVRQGFKFIFEPTAFINIMGAAAIAAMVCALTWGEAAATVPFRWVVTFYAAAAAPYFLLSTVLVARYRETERHLENLREMFSPPPASHR
jgi:phosphatidylserine synthase